MKTYLSIVFCLVLLVSSLSFAVQTDPEWYPLSSEEEAAPTWQVISRSDTLVSLQISLPGFFYFDQDGERRLYMENSDVYLNEAYPAIRSSYITIGIPKCSGVSITTQVLASEQVSGWPVAYPNPQIVENGGVYSEVYYKDSGAYKTSGFLPGATASTIGTRLFRAQNLLRLHATPITYNPDTDVYAFASELQVDVHIASPTGQAFPDLGTFGAVIQYMTGTIA